MKNSKRVLVVDGNRFNSSMITIPLQKILGYEPDLETNLQDALDSYEPNKYGLYLIKGQIPKNKESFSIAQYSNSKELIEYLNPRARKSEIIVYTDSPQIREMEMKNGRQAFLSHERMDMFKYIKNKYGKKTDQE